MAKKLETTTKPCEIGVDYSFDIYPPLERTKANQEQYKLFLRKVLDTYGLQNSDSVEQGDGGSVVRVNAKSEGLYIDFEVGEHPHLPHQCEHFLWFSSSSTPSHYLHTLVVIIG